MIGEIWGCYLMVTVLSRIVDPSVAWEMVPPLEPLAWDAVAPPITEPPVAAVCAALPGRFLPLRGRASDWRTRERKKRKDSSRAHEECRGRAIITPRRH